MDSGAVPVVVLARPAEIAMSTMESHPLPKVVAVHFREGQGVLSASARASRSRMRLMQDWSVPAPMKMQPCLLAASAMLLRSRRTGSHTTCPGRAKRSTISAIPASSRCRP